MHDPQPEPSPTDPHAEHDGVPDPTGSVPAADEAAAHAQQAADAEVKPQADTDSFDLTPEGQEPDIGNIDFGAATSAEPRTEAGGSDLQSERDELESKLLRTTADYQNYIRRSGRELEQARQQRVVDVARALIGALDDFDRAVTVDPEKTSVAELMQGIASVRDGLIQSLQHFGFKRVEVEPGTEFDPNIHEALMHQPHDDVEAGHVVQTFMPGYFVNEVPVRPVQVSVAQ